MTATSQTSNNDFSAIFTVHAAGLLAPACRAHLTSATESKSWGRVAALAEMLVTLKGEDALTETGLILANYVHRAIARDLAASLLAA